MVSVATLLFLKEVGLWGVVGLWLLFAHLWKADLVKVVRFAAVLAHIVGDRSWGFSAVLAHL